MKILTNVRFFRLAGISQALSSLSSYIKKNGDSKKMELIGVEMANAKSSRGPIRIKEAREKNFRVITATMPHPDIKDLAKNSRDIGDVEEKLQPLIKQYQQIIEKEQPDVVLLNGTYFLPWCLFMAARKMISNIVLHYHGSLTKETEHYSDPVRAVFRQMEKTFDSEKLRYIFPSLLAKNTVSKEVFGHEPKHFCILPNPIPLHFFDVVKGKGGAKKRIGTVARWRYVKNKSFIEEFAVHNGRLLESAIFNLLTDLQAVADIPSHIRRLIRITRPMKNDEMAQFYSKMDLIVCPSRFETYGNVAQEAIASGTPALVSDKMGVSEQFGKFGLENWVASFDSPEEVFKKIDCMMEETVKPELRLEMRQELNPDKIHGLLLNYLRAK